MVAVRTYLDPTAPIAADAIVVDDPKLAMDLAVAVCESPRMSNLVHGLWGYHGTTGDGDELTVQSLGIGGPSAAAVMADLARFGVARAVRIGSCIALEAALEAGSALVATSFEPADGAGTVLAEGRLLTPDPELTDALADATGVEARGALRSADIIGEDAGAADGAAALDMASAAFAAASARGGVACAEAVVVCRSASGLELGLDELHGAMIGLGKRAAAALGAVAQAS